MANIRSAMDNSNAFPKAHGSTERALGAPEDSGVIVTTPYVPVANGHNATIRSAYTDDKFKAPTGSVSKAAPPKPSATRSAMENKKP